MTPPTIVLIGPYLSGKSTQGELLSEALGLPLFSLNPWFDDDVFMRYFREAGYDEAKEDQVIEAQGAQALDEFFEPFRAYAVEHSLLDHPGHVVVLDARLTVYDDEQLLRRVEQALAPLPNVFLLLPSPDPDESYRLLRERLWAQTNWAEHEHFVRHHSNHDLAKYTVYTEGLSPEQTRDEILQFIAADGAPLAPIMLIGPPGAGKSTISNLLESRLKLPAVGLDVVGWDYARAAGYDQERAARIREQEGEPAARRYEQLIWSATIEQAIAENPEAIFDFGAGHSVYEDADAFERVRRAMAPHQHIFLLLPSPDLDESVQILRERPRFTIKGIDANKYLIDHPSNQRLAKRVVYTKDKTPEQTRDKILTYIH